MQWAVRLSSATVGVHLIRTDFTPDDKGVDVARGAQAQDIKIEWLVQLQYRPDAPQRPWLTAYHAWEALHSVLPIQTRSQLFSTTARQA
jgi:hypothetical protein